jgi:hypothetical protein
VNDPILAGERARLREAAERARVEGRGERLMLAVRRSIERFALRLEGDAVSEPDASGRVAEIRKLARSQMTETRSDGKLALASDRSRASARDPQPSRSTTGESEQAERYKQLEDELRQRGTARTKRTLRDRNSDGRTRS